MNNSPIYRHFDPIPKLNELVHSFWMHANISDEIETFTFAPDGYFKIIIYYRNNEIIRYFQTGILSKSGTFHIPPKTIGFGCRFKILAPEYLFNKRIANIHNKEKPLSLDYLNMRKFDFESPRKLKEHWEKELLKIMPQKDISNHKLRLSELIYQTRGTLSVTEISNQIYWEKRQINRYFNKNLGLSLKTYLNIQRAYDAYFNIRKGNLKPSLAFYDQPHFIKEIKKHTGVSPKKVFNSLEEVFKQIHLIKKK